MARQPLHPAMPEPADGPGPLPPPSQATSTVAAPGGSAAAAPGVATAAATGAAPGTAPTGSPPADLWSSLGWQPSPPQLEQLIELQRLLRQWNQRLNLTRLVEGDDYWIAQVYDSLWPLLAPGAAPAPPASEPLRLIDVGTGGGFPGLALAIAWPQAQVTLVDSVGRKLEAVGAMAQSLGLQDRIQLRCERIERSGRSPECRGRFDWAVARAVAAAPVVAEYLVPLLAPGGQAVLYRGQWTQADGQALQAALGPLRAELSRLERRELPHGRGLRHALWLRSLKPCPATYPRAVGTPARLPLGQPGSQGRG